MVGLIGPDGVGKSSLLSLIAGARAIQEGQVEVLGGDMARRAPSPGGLPAHRLHAAGPGQESLSRRCRSSRTSTSSAACSATTPRSARRRIAELLRSTGLAPFADRPAGKLSGGMKQKLGLCCALIHDPDLLILDEPTTGVDPLSRRQFWELIDRIRASRPGMSVLVATAYMEEAARFDWLVAMDAGRVLATGTPGGAARAHRHRDRWRRPSSPCCRRRSAAATSAVVIPPRRRHDGEIAIEAQGLTMRFGDFVAVDHVELPHRARRDLRLPRLQRLRQDDDDEDADRPAAGQRGAGLAVRPAGRSAATSRPAAASATCRRPSRSTPS